MKTKNLLFLLMLASFALLAMPRAFAYTESGHIGLLTVAESGNASERGGIADLYLTIKPGTGRIFIDSFPLSKLDTQITMRFASELACDYLDIDCSQYDFFYTIRANSAIVGGPSAGAAATVLTIAMLDEQRLDQKTIMTGTINSGYLVGPVAGISAKTLAAQQHGYTKALIPKWEVPNESVSPGLKMKVVPVSTLDEAMYQFTGKNYTRNTMNLSPSKEYVETMHQVALDLCSVYGTVTSEGIMLNSSLPVSITDTTATQDNSTINSTPDSNTTINTPINAPNVSINTTGANESLLPSAKSARQYYLLASKALHNGEYYSAASFCFGGNVQIATGLMKPYSQDQLTREYSRLTSDIARFNNDLKARRISNIAQLETYMIVKERVDEAQQLLESPKLSAGVPLSYSDIAYARERLNTATIWSRFFNLPGAEISFNDESLLDVCARKIQEAEERINYLQMYFPTDIDRSELDKAYSYYNSKEYPLCIFSASKAKASVDVVLGALFVSESNIEQLRSEKLNAAREQLSFQQSKGIFPILGYSYYEYANTLSGKSEIYSSLIYSEYALELGNIDMYFPRKHNTAGAALSGLPPLNGSSAGFPAYPSFVYLLLIGFLLGLIVAIIVGYVVRIKTERRFAQRASHSSRRRRR